MIRLYLLCLFIARKAAPTKDGQGHLILVPLFTEVNIYKLSPCSSSWLKGYKKIKSVFHTTDTSYGLYYCMEPQQFMYIVKSESDLTLIANPEGGIIGDKLILTCSMTLAVTEYTVSYLLQILDSSEIELANNKAKVSATKTETIEVNVSSFELFETGYQIVYCQCYLEMEYEEVPARHALSTNATIQTYIVPMNVTPDKTEVTLGETVICQSIADPPAKHTWSCLGGEWSSKGARLTPNAPGELNCSCSAISVLQGVSYEITWHGIIRVLDVASCSSTRIPQLYVAILFLASKQF